MIKLDKVRDMKNGDDFIYIEMEYIGKRLSKNYSKTRDRHWKPIVRKWMDQLSFAVHTQKIELKPPIKIEVIGYFKDRRYPDLANLHEVIGDGIKRGLGIDDKYFYFEDRFAVTGVKDPSIQIIIKEIPEVLF